MPRRVVEGRATFWGVALLGALLFCITNLPWHLDDYDQAKQAFTSFEMVNAGHWLYQHTPNEKVATKPPLVGWISAGVYAITRSWEIAWRLPSIAAAVLLAFVLTRAATNAYGPAAGLFAMSAFSLNLLSPRLATLVRTDMPLALVVFLLGLKIWSRVRAANRSDRSDRWVIFCLLSAAMLIKGPIVYAFLLPGIALFQWLRRDTNTSAWCGAWPWAGSLAVFLAWTAGGIAWQHGFYEQVVLREFAGRFGDTVHRPQPIYFYLPHLLHKFAPWSVLSIALAVVAWRTSTSPRWRTLSPDVLWLLCWSLGGLLAMSLIPSKRVDRIFPIVPPLCLLLATQVARAWDSARVRKWAVVALGFACIFTSGYAAQKILTGYRSGRGALAAFGHEVRIMTAANGWRYEVVGRKEEGLLLYLRKTRFLKAEEARELWNAGALDAVVAPAEDLPRMSLIGATPAGPDATIIINAQPRRYVLLKHEGM